MHRPYVHAECTVLYCTVLYCTVLYCTVLYCTVLYCTVLYCTVLYCTALHCTALHCTALHCTALHCTALLHCTECSVSKQDTWQEAVGHVTRPTCDNGGLYGDTVDVESHVTAVIDDGQMCPDTERDDLSKNAQSSTTYSNS